MNNAHSSILVAVLAASLLLSAAACTPALPQTSGPTAPAAAPAPQTTRIPTADPQPTALPAAAVQAEPTPQAVPDGRTTLLVLGSDYRPRSGYRTDTILLVTVDARKGTVSAVSFPRDLYVEIPGWKTQRINTAMQHGGFDLMADTFEANFGVRPDFYIMTNMQGFVEIVDSLGGITVSAGKNLSDECSLPQAVQKRCSIEAGTVEMDGATALWYVRSRYSTSDFDRLRRAQEVLMALFERLMDGIQGDADALARLPEFYAAYQDSVETNLRVEDITPLLPTAVRVLSDESRIQRYALTREEARPYRTENGASVLLPDAEKIGRILEAAVFAE